MHHHLLGGANGSDSCDTTFVCVTRDASNKVCLYIDGVQQGASETYSATPQTLNSDDGGNVNHAIRIGGGNSSGGQDVFAYLDDIVIINGEVLPSSICLVKPTQRFPG